MSKQLFKNYPKVEYNVTGDGRDIQTIRNIMLRAKIRDSIKKDVAVYYDYEIKEAQTPQEIAERIYGDPNLFWVIFMMNDVVDPFYDMGLSQRQLAKYIDKKYPGKSWAIQSYSGSIYRGSSVVGSTSGATGEIIEWNPTQKKVVIDVKSGTIKLGENLTVTTIRNDLTLTGAILLGSTSKLNKFSLHHYENTETEEIVDYEDYVNLPISSKREVDNYTYETEVNEKKKIIKLLRPEYIEGVVDEIETILRS